MRLAATLSAVIVLIGIAGAPAMPVMLGAAAAYGWLLWRAAASR